MSSNLLQLAQALKEGNRRALAKAITMVESTRPHDRQQAQQLLTHLAAATTSHKGIRLGFSGAPGVGKSTFIERFGLMLIDQGRKVAVLAIDPSSPVTGGSLMGDKTRMTQLSQHTHAFVRPSPSRGNLGGVASMTRETILLCEAAGFDLVIVESVGVGQSEVALASMVDCFVLLLQPHAGDDLQGIKKGIIELADLMVVNKDDRSLREAAAQTQLQYQQALSLMQHTSGRMPSVLRCSALTGDGLSSVWESIQSFYDEAKKQGYFDWQRRQQRIQWLNQMVHTELTTLFFTHPRVSASWAEIETAVADQRMTPLVATQRLLDAFSHD